MQAWAFLRAVYKDWVALMSGIASIVLGFFATFTEFAIQHARAMLWAAAAACFVVTSYRVWVREREKVQKLNAKLTPSLEVEFGSDQPFVQVTEYPQYQTTVTYHGVRIRNTGNSTATRVRIQVEGFEDVNGNFKTIPYWNFGFNKPEVLLDPGETKLLLLFQAHPKESEVMLAGPYNSTVLRPGRHDLLIRVMARDLPAREVRGILEVTSKGSAVLRAA
jgi:hypothetical protein